MHNELGMVTSTHCHWLDRLLGTATMWGDMASHALDKVQRRRLRVGLDIVGIAVGHGTDRVMRTVGMVLDGQHFAASPQIPNQLRTALWAAHYWLVDVAFRDPIKVENTHSVCKLALGTSPSL